MENRKKNIVISALATSLSASAALVPVQSSIVAAFPDYANWVQLLISVPPLFIMGSSLLVSPLLKFFSSKKITIIGLLLIIFSGVYPYFTASFPLLLLSRVIMGIGLGLITPISSSLPASYYKAGENRDLATGLQAAFNSFGGILFSFLSGFLANIFWKNIFLIQLLNLIPLIIILFFMEEDKDFEVKKEERKGEIFVKEAFLLTLLAFITITITVTFPFNLSIYIKNKGLGTTNLGGIITSVNSFMGFIIGLMFSKIRNRFRKNTLPMSLWLVGISFFINAWANTPLTLFIGSTIFGISTSIIYPAFLTMIYGEVPEEKIVAAIGMYTIATNISQFVSPFIINPLAGLLGEGIKYRFILCGIGVIILGLFIYFYFSKPKKYGLKG